MKFTFLNSKSNTPIDKIDIDENATLLLGDGYLPPLNLDDELTGVSNFIKSLCILSRKKNNLILAGCKIYCKNKTFWGTLVVEGGKFLGISDMTHSIDGTFDQSSNICVFECTNFRVGIVSGDDIFFPEVARIMRLWECDLLVFSIRGHLTRAHRILGEAHAITNGVTAICFSSDKVCALGAKNLISTKSDLFVTLKQSDTLVSHRRPDCYIDLVKKPSL